MSHGCGGKMGNESDFENARVGGRGYKISKKNLTSFDVSVQNPSADARQKKVVDVGSR